MPIRKSTLAWCLLAAVPASLAALWLLNARTGDSPEALRPELPEPPASSAMPEAPPPPSGVSAPPDPSDASNLPSPAEPAGGLAVPEPLAFRAWEPVDESSVDALPAYKETVEGRALVRIPESAGGWSAGAELEFEVPQLGWTLAGVIESAEDDPWGNRSLVGLLREPDGSEHRFVMTIGARNQFANFGTSRGAFELVAADGLGWLMPRANMDTHVDYGRPDYVIRDRPGP